MILAGSLLIFCLVTSSTFQTAVASESEFDSRSVERINIIGGSLLIYKKKPRLKETTTRGPTTTTQGPQTTTTTTQGPVTNYTDYCRSKCPISSIKFRQGKTLLSTPLHTQSFQSSGACKLLARCYRLTPNNTNIPPLTLTLNNNTVSVGGISWGLLNCNPDLGYWQYYNDNFTEVGCVERLFYFYNPQAYIPPDVLPPVPANPTCQQCSDSQLVLSADNGTANQNTYGWLYPVYSVYNNLTDGCLTLRAQCEGSSLEWNTRYNPPQWMSVFGPQSAQLLFNYGTVQVPAENGVTYVDLKCKNGQWIYNNGGVDTQVNQIKCRFFNATSTSG
uniref:C-type lectin domain-containing protein n=1 Tax=Acrobeloides nanus TaxID=290746 RepID=A0A914CGM8_9BILA